MKQLLQTGMATTRLIGLLVVFFMMAPSVVVAQTSSSGNRSHASGSGSSGAFTKVAVPKSVAASQPMVSIVKNRPFTKADGGDLVQVTHDGTTTSYQTWNAAVEALQVNDVITLLQDVELVYGDDPSGEPEFKMPKVACTIQGTEATTVLESTSTIEMEAPITFKNITLNLKELVACGNALVFDAGITCTNENMTVCGGSGLYEEGVEIKSTSITIKSGTFYEVYGGGFYADVIGDTYVEVQDGSIQWLYGGGSSAEVTGTANVEIKGGSIDYVFGGGDNEDAICGNTNLTVKDGTIGKNDDSYRYNLVGGGKAAPVTGNAKVTIEGGTFNCFISAGGGLDSETTATCGSTELNITGGTFTKWTYGGGWSSPVLGTATVKVSGSPSLSTLCGGGVMATASCENTDVQIGSDIDGWLFGGGESAPVTGTAKLTISGGTILGSVCGGGCQSTASCNKTELFFTGGNISGSVYGGSENDATVGSTYLEIFGGTFNWINGGGLNGNVTGECYLKISGDPVINENVFGGSDALGTTVGSTRVEISGGTFENNIFGGGWGCNVLGDTHVSVTGGTIEYDVFGGGSQGQVLGSTNVVIDGDPTISSVFGGGWGDDSEDGEYSSDNGRVGNANVTINNVKGNNNIQVYGNGYYSSVTNNINITVNDGEQMSVYGLYAGQDYALQAGGDVNLVLNGGKIVSSGLVVNDLMNEHTIGGKATLTVSPKIDATNLSNISSGNPKTGVVKETTFVFKDCGTQEEPYEIPYTLQGFSTVELDNSFVKSKVAEEASESTGILLDVKQKNTFVGSGWCEQVNVGPFPFNNGGDGASIIEDMETLFTLEGPELVDEDVFKLYPSNLGDFAFFRVGDTYRLMQMSDSDSDDFFSMVTTETVEGGDISIFWKDTKVFSGDKIPFRTFSSTSLISELTIDVLPDEGYSLKDGSIKVYKTGDENTPVELKEGNTFILPEYDVTVTAEFEKIPYQITVLPMENGSITATPNMDVTIGIPVNLTVTPDAGYRLKSGSLKVYKTGDESTTVAISGNSFNMPAYNVTVFAKFEKIPYVPEPEPEPTVFYTVSIPSVEGITTDPVAGDYEVEAWDSFRFFLTLDKDYDQSEPIVTTDRGETLAPRTSDGAYVVKYVRSDVEISIDGIVKNPDPVANIEIESGVKAWTSNHRLFIHTNKAEDVFIYTFGGELRKTFRSAGGEEQVPLSSGSYIIRIGEDDFKVIL